MWRKENQKPDAGSFSVPLFNQRKRSRLPLTPNPSESERFTANHYNETQSSSSPAFSSQSGQWRQQVYLSSQHSSMRSAPSPAVESRGYAPLPHPRKPALTRSQAGQQRPAVRQDSMAANGSQPYGGFPSSSSVSHGQPRWSSVIQNQQSFNSLTTSPRMPYRPQQCPQQCPPAAGSTQDPGAQSHSGMWNFRPVGQSTGGMWGKEKMETSGVRTTPQQQKPPRETSLRVITAVIEGMKHWSQYKNRVPMLFEIFATLDSAVTVGEHGAKKFLMRDGKDVVQGLYYENDQTLPRLIRGQVHRCVGNYDRQKDSVTCVSVRAASLAEQSNALEAVRASDAEMRNVVLALRET